MSEFPTFNFKTVYFFLISLFGIIFILSLMDLIKVKNPMAILIVSFLNVFVSIFAWIIQMNIDNAYEGYVIEHKKSRSELKEDLEWYRRQERNNTVIVFTVVFILTLFALIPQIVQ